MEGSVSIDALDLLPNTDLKCYLKMAQYWEVGEVGAVAKLKKFIAYSLKDYGNARNFPGVQGTSRISPHLHFGEISPNQIWYCVKESNQAEDPGKDVYMSELGWREFSYYLVYHFPYITEKNLQKKFDHFPWKYNNAHLRAWQYGQTGIPIVDAGMRELYETGYA